MKMTTGNQPELSGDGLLINRAQSAVEIIQCFRFFDHSDCVIYNWNQDSDK